MSILKKVGVIAVIILSTMFTTPTNRVVAFDEPQSFWIRDVDQSFPVDFYGNGDYFTVTLTRHGMQNSMEVTKAGDLVQSFNLGFDGGNLLVSNFRGGARQDIAFVSNGGSGGFIQVAKIFGYDGNCIAILLEIPGDICQGNKAGKFIGSEGLYFQYIAGHQQYKIRINTDGYTYWLGSSEA